MYDKLTETYVLDPENRAFLQEANPWALHGIAERLLEASGRGLWEQPPADMVAALTEVLLEAEGQIEGRTTDPSEARASDRGSGHERLVRPTNESQFPFSAVDRQKDLGLARCLSVVSPIIGGVLVRGEKGTAKSTTVRALASVLPLVAVVDDCRFSCDPDSLDLSCPDADLHAATDSERPVRLVELPVGASEDRVVGSLHLDRLVSSGQVAFEPGLLARAHRGLLYVDEVNLLPDHLVDSLLDAAAMAVRASSAKRSRSATTPWFVLVGTMNPEEGELRPQLLDRFGLAVDVAASREPSERVEVVRRGSPSRPTRRPSPPSTRPPTPTSRPGSARPRGCWRVLLPDDVPSRSPRSCAAYDVDGLRGDLVMARTAVAHAAWCGLDHRDH